MRMYVIVNKDMGKKINKRGKTNKYHHVQATHATAEYCLMHSDAKAWNNETLIVLGASEKQFHYYMAKINRECIPISCFFEPDLNNEYTAFACIPYEDEYKIFKNLELL